MALTKEEVKKLLETDLLEELKLMEVSDDAKYAILGKLADVVYLRFVNQLTEALSDEDTEKLEDILDRGAADEFEALIAAKVPNYNEILSQIIAEEKSNLLAAAGV
jgi:vacuolar-type H+-ATPase subunit C/Vma6